MCDVFFDIVVSSVARAFLICKLRIEPFINNARFFYKKLFSFSAETFLTFTRFQCQNFLKTFLAKFFDIPTFCICTIEENEKLYLYLKL